MKRVALLFVLVTGMLSASAQYDPEALKSLDAMSAKYKNAPAFSAEFTQNLKNPTAGLDESIEGKIAVMKDKYYLQVSGQHVYNNGVDIYTYNPEINEVTIAPYDSNEEEISLSNIYEIYKTGFKYSIYEEIKGIKYIDLDPEDRKGKSYFKIRMEIDAQNDLKAFSLFEPSGNVYRYSINNFKERGDLGEDYFSFDPSSYDEIEVVDFR